MNTAGTVHQRWQNLNPEARDAHGADGRRANLRRRDFREMRQNPDIRSTRPRHINAGDAFDGIYISRELQIACSMSRRNRSDKAPILPVKRCLSIARICSVSAFES